VLNKRRGRRPGDGQIGVQKTSTVAGFQMSKQTTKEDRHTIVSDGVRYFSDLCAIPHDSSVHIYGCSKRGKDLADLIRHTRKDIHISGFIDSFAEGELDGFRIRSVHDYFTLKKTSKTNDILIVASNYSDEIIRNLNSNGVTGVYCYCVSSIDLAPYQSDFLLDFEHRSILVTSPYKVIHKDLDYYFAAQSLLKKDTIQRILFVESNHPEYLFGKRCYCLQDKQLDVIDHTNHAILILSNFFMQVYYFLNRSHLREAFIVSDRMPFYLSLFRECIATLSVFKKGLNLFEIGCIAHISGGGRSTEFFMNSLRKTDTLVSISNDADNVEYAKMYCKCGDEQVKILHVDCFDDSDSIVNEFQGLLDVVFFHITRDTCKESDLLVRLIDTYYVHMSNEHIILFESVEVEAPENGVLYKLLLSMGYRMLHRKLYTGVMIVAALKNVDINDNRLRHVMEEARTV
jgi:hypothetical protein